MIRLPRLSAALPWLARRPRRDAGPRLAIIGSCVTRDVWNLAEAPHVERKKQLYLARTSFASLFAEPSPAFQAPDTLPPELSAWEMRMVADDVLKRGVPKLLEFRPTHLILDLIDERFDLLRRGPSVVTHSWELHLTGLDAGLLSDFQRIPRMSPEADALWRGGLDRLAALVRAKLPATQVIFHDARWALEYLDEDGARRAFDPERVLWPGVPANIHAHNALLERYAGELRRAFPDAAHVSASPEAALGDARHRWGLSPFHYVDAYYREIWAQLEALGCLPGVAAA